MFGAVRCAALVRPIATQTSIGGERNDTFSVEPRCRNGVFLLERSARERSAEKRRKIARSNGPSNIPRSRALFFLADSDRRRSRRWSTMTTHRFIMIMVRSAFAHISSSRSSARTSNAIKSEKKSASAARKSAFRLAVIVLQYFNCFSMLIRAVECCHVL